MSVCHCCHENVAVIYRTRAHEEGESAYEGYCLSCALRHPELGLEQMLRQAGLNEENVDAITAQLNQVMEPMKEDSPEELFTRLQEIMGNMPQDLPGAQGLAQAFGALQPGEDGKQEESQESAEEGSGEAEPRSASSPFSGFFGREGLAAMGEQSVGEALQMMISGVLGMGDPEQAGLMPATHGQELLAEEEEQGAKQSRQAGRRTREGGRDKRRSRKLLEHYGRNLNAAARAGELDPLIGRAKELERVIQILNRRMKNNPVLLGEPGVGKTAIAEGLASRIVAGEVPAKLQDMEVYLLDMTAMVAGTQFRGQFESRMKGLVEEARDLGNIILVIDELHNIMGAGDAEGSMNAANILKPSLAKGEIRILGSTTLSEYRRFIEKDSALERRFQQVLVEEPDREACLEILHSVSQQLERYHQVRIPEALLGQAYDLAERYVPARFFPDKAIDILDEASSAANLGDQALVRHLKLQQEYEALQASHREQQQVLKTDEDQAQLYEREARYKAQCLRLEQAIKEAEAELQPPELTREDLAQVVELWTGIPLSRLTEEDNQRLRELESRLHQRVIAQDEAVGALARGIRRSRSGLGQRHKPASFIFVGPTGVGKTELVKALAWALFDREDSLVRLDMSEYMEAHTVSKLIGSPPGYVGYDEAGQLTEKIRRHPYSVILLDEIEKAHQDVYNMLLQILDDGRLTDSHGRTVNFEHCVIVMTSNAGTSQRQAAFGFGSTAQQAKEQVGAALKEIFRPEFLNRIDEIIVFEELKPEEIRQIVDLMLAEPQAQLRERGIELRLTEAAKDQLAQLGYDPRNGARPLRRAIRREVEDLLADALLDGRLEGKIGVSVDYRDGAFSLDSL